jgi:anti-sigma B factor antagonist
MFGIGEARPEDSAMVVYGATTRPLGSAKAERGIPEPAGPSRLRVQVIERVAIVRFADSTFLVGKTSAREVHCHLTQLVETQGHLRIVLDLDGVRWLSSEMLAALVSFQRELDRRGGRIQLCRLDPLVRELLRTSHLDSLFDICADEADAMGILVR